MTLIQKGLVIAIVLLFIGTCTIPATTQKIEKSSTPITRENWLYVGGSGPENYTTIQNALDNTSDGDIVFVYSGTYSECIHIRKEITLLGESKNSTIIEVQRVNEVVDILANYTSIVEFTIRNLNTSGYWIIEMLHVNHVTISKTIIDGINTHSGIVLNGANDNMIRQNDFVRCNTAINIFSSGGYSKNNTIVENNISGNFSGIKITKSDYNNISNNKLVVPKYGIELYESNHNIIRNNVILDANKPILIYGTSSVHIISYNRIENTNSSKKYDSGIMIDEGYDPYILNNIISNYTFGIYLKDTFNSIIEKNNFFNNTVHARFFNTGNSIWRNNYWGRSRILPKPIFGVKDIEEIRPHFFEFDRHPALKPYTIP